MRARRWLFWSGLACLITGALMLSYVWWEFQGSDVVSRRHQEQRIAALRTQWAGESVGSRVEQPAGPGDASALIRIPRFGRSYVMPVLEGTTEEVLAQGFGHFLGTAQPGQVGNYALAAHRVTHGQPLRRMPELRAGDLVVVETGAATYRYVLDTGPDDLVVPFTAGWVLAPLPVNPSGGPAPDAGGSPRLITLTTCAELFHTDDRIVVFGHLTSVQPKAVPSASP